MGTMALGRDDIGLLSSGNGSGDSFLFHAIQHEMHSLAYSAIWSVWKCQDSTLHS